MKRKDFRPQQKRVALYQANRYLTSKGSTWIAVAKQGDMPDMLPGGGFFKGPAD